LNCFTNKKSKPTLKFISFLSLFIITCILFNPPIIAAEKKSKESKISKKNKIPHVRPNVKALDLTRPPINEELMAAGQLGGTLYPTRDIGSRMLGKAPLTALKNKQNISILSSVGNNTQNTFKKIEQENLAFGKAIQKWNKHEYKEASKMFKEYVEEYPDSPWVSEAILHEGCDSRYNGLYTEAEESFTTIIEDNEGNDFTGAKRLVNKARSRLAVLKVLQNNIDEAMWHFSSLKSDSLSWRDRTYASHWIQRLSRHKANKMALLNCGVQALAHVLKKDGKQSESKKVIEILPTSNKGQSIQELKNIAAGYGYTLTGLRLTVSDLKTIPLPAIIQISSRNKGDSGHYWVLEKIVNDEIRFFDPQSRRRFHQSLKAFDREWSGNALVFSNNTTLPGIKLDEAEMGSIYGGCCGAQAPEDPLGDPGGDSGGSSGSGSSCGAPTWSVNPINLNLFVKDTPLWYSSPVGPSVGIRLSYNSKSAINFNEPFGNKWQFNYGSFLVVDTGGNVTIFMPDGRRDVYTPDGVGGYDSPFKIHNDLTLIAANHFELRFPDDTVYEYDIPSGTGSLQPFLVEIRDAHGQALTFGYNGNVELTTITDAMARVTTLTYDANGLVTQVGDPFGRNALFEYDVNRNLTKITDMGGYWTSLTYDVDVNLASIADDRGVWGFYMEPADGTRANTDNYPSPGGTMWENSRITITNPLGGKEEYFYFGGCDNVGCDGSSWYVSPENYIDWQSEDINNFKSNTPKTRYLFTYLLSEQRAEIGEIIYPRDGFVEYSYDADGNRTSVTDSHWHTTSYTYNSLGKITSITDPKANATNMTYAANGVDLLSTQDGLGTVAMTYNSTHDLTSVTDRLGNKTAYTYNSFGQVTSRTDAEGVLDRVTNYTYDTNNLLEQVTKDGYVIDTFTYDLIGRVDTHTDATGLTLSYEYNNLDNITKITYPDAKFVTYTYSGCCPHLQDSVTDRAGRTTNYTYDALKRRIATINPGGGIISNEYDDNGNVIKLVDPHGNATYFEYDLDDLLVKRTYDDGKSISLTYDDSGLLTRRTNSRGIHSDYVYDENHNTLTTTYSDVTPGVTYQYDNYDRVTTRQDGTGLYSYSYDSNSRLTGIDGPLVNDTLTYQYDELGRKTGLVPQGGQNITQIYDGLDRLTDIQIGANTYSYSYTSANPLVNNLTRPNGTVTTYQYDTLNRRTEVSNKDSSAIIINRYTYAYNAVNNPDTRSSETITNGNPITSLQNQLTSYDNNELNQLLSSTSPNSTFIYDDDGNMTQGYTPAGYLFTAAYDAENRLSSIVYTDSSSVVHKTEYLYSGNSFIAEIKKYEDNVIVTTNRFVRDGFLPIQERDENNTVNKENTWGLNMGGGIGGLLNMNQSGQDYAYLYDGKGNVTTLLDSTESVVSTYTYDTFGNLMSETGTLDQPFRFSTKRYDEALGMSYYGYRFYSPALSRWLNRDPIGETGGINLYGFVQNNTVNFVDSLGLRSIVPWTIANETKVFSTRSKGFSSTVAIMSGTASALGFGMTAAALGITGGWLVAIPVAAFFGGWAAGMGLDLLLDKEMEIIKEFSETNLFCPIK
jgi:RHS repeat-associated protein